MAPAEETPESINGEGTVEESDGLSFLLPSMAASRVTPTAVAAAPTTNRLANHAPMAFAPAMTVGAINGMTAIASPVGSVYLIGLLPRSYRWRSPP